MAAPTAEAPEYSLGSRRVVQLDGSGLVRVGARPTLGQYLKQLWQFRHFLYYDSRSRVSSQNNFDSLGRVWMVVNPILLGLAFFVVFGLILESSRGIANFLGYLVIGIFMFRFFTSAITGAANSIAGNQNVVQSFNFPRAALPLSAAVRELFASVPVFVVMALLAYFLGGYQITPDESNAYDVELTWHWLLFFPAVALALMTMAGVGLLLARLVNSWNDTKHLITFGTRVLLYTSCVFFSIERYERVPWMKTIVEHNPLFCVLDIVRHAWLYDGFADPHRWVVLSVWAVASLVIGFIVFWLGEESYGKER
ncbi:ABC transporter permease [Nesterenkonia flava]|uniref:Transport permease protein n=1 Tax=Nesterenkonia flava TaxID=469799 RepID=A0ABU1FSU9_9MICC|nr:ABC transporter permease [Nesterenkonia flava]MDR5711683.1 ABC transporter permease [Nesterenkonia flava]